MEQQPNSHFFLLGQIDQNVKDIKATMLLMEGKNKEQDIRLDTLEEDKAEARGYKRALMAVITFSTGVIGFLYGKG